jgi:hypothetical protein
VQLVCKFHNNTSKLYVAIVALALSAILLAVPLINDNLYWHEIGIMSSKSLPLADSGIVVKSRTFRGTVRITNIAFLESDLDQHHFRSLGAHSISSGSGSSYVDESLVEVFDNGKDFLDETVLEFVLDDRTFKYMRSFGILWYKVDS